MLSKHFPAPLEEDAISFPKGQGGGVLPTVRNGFAAMAVFRLFCQISFQQLPHVVFSLLFNVFSFVEPTQL